MDAACDGRFFYVTPKLTVVLDLDDPLSVSTDCSDPEDLEGEWV